MADEDDKPKKHTFESLYHMYCNYYATALDFDNEEYHTIVLSQIDKWLEHAKLLRHTFTLTETGLAYMRFKKWRLTYSEFMEFLEIILQGKNITLDALKAQMLEAGMPGGSDIPPK